jgi:hypothetical protein
MELAGLEPATSWVRCGEPSSMRRARFRPYQGESAQWPQSGERRMAVDHPLMSVDLGHWNAAGAQWRSRSASLPLARQDQQALEAAGLGE